MLPSGHSDLAARAAALNFPHHGCGGRLPARFSRATALSSAQRKFERSRGPKALGPEVVSPVERKWSIRLRVASAMPIELSLKRLPVGAITSAPSLTQRLAKGMSEVTTIAPGPAR